MGRPSFPDFQVHVLAARALLWVALTVSSAGETLACENFLKWHFMVAVSFPVNTNFSFSCSSFFFFFFVEAFIVFLLFWIPTL